MAKTEYHGPILMADYTPGNTLPDIGATFHLSGTEHIRTDVASPDRRVKSCDPVQAENYRRRSEAYLTPDTYQ